MTISPARTTIATKASALRLAVRRRELSRTLGALALLMALAALNLYRKGLGLTFNYDEWNWVMNRRDWSLGVLLEPHNEHLVLVPVLIFKVLFVTVGLDNYAAYRLSVIAVHLMVAALVFVFARPRVGNFFALAAASLILFIGSAWQDVLWPLQIGYLLAVAAGVGMLMALARRDLSGDIVACALLVLGIASASVALPFAAAAAVAILWRRNGSWRSRERWRRLWLVAIPLALYALWFVFYGNPNATPGAAHGFGLVRQNGPAVPAYGAEMAASATAGLAGLAIDWGVPLVVAGLIVAMWVASRQRLTSNVLALTTALLAFWGLTALLRAQLNDAASSRYIYPGAVLLVLLAVELVRGARPTPVSGAIVTSAVLVAVLGNYGMLRSGSLQLQDWSRYVRAELGALELAGPSTDPNYAPDSMRAPDITAGRYFAAVRELGSPADTPSEILAQAEPQREAADGVLVAALRFGVRPTGRFVRDPRQRLTTEGVAGAEARPERGCVRMEPSGSSPGLVELLVPRNGIAVANRGGAPLEVRLRSFATNFPAQPVGVVAPHAAAVLAVPGPVKHLPWHAQLTLGGAAQGCAIGPESA
jgi:hypothetical protein